MMLGHLAVRAWNNVSPSRASISLIAKVICRTVSDQNIKLTEKWDVLSAVCLERHPVIIKPMRDIEVRYQKMLRQIEMEHGITSDFEKRKRKSKTQNVAKSSEDVVGSNRTLQDFEDMWEQELENFKFAPKTSDDNTLASLKRKLDKNLILLVEQQIGNAKFWIPPQSVRMQSESMIETAQRTLQEHCGSTMKVHFYGNAPIGFYKYTYPASMQEKGRKGAKIFYFLAKHVGGDISSNINYCWLDREELKNTVHPGVCKSLTKFLLPD